MPSRPLSATSALRRLSFGHFSESDTPNLALRKQILARDKNKCADCGVVFARHMEVRHLDDDHTNMSPGNLVTVCPFCHSRDHLHTTGFANAGQVIASTHLNQAIINSVVMACWYVQSRVVNKTDIRKLPEPGENTDELQQLRTVATLLLDDIQGRGIRWASAFGHLVADPDAFAEVLSDMSIKEPESYADRGELTKHLHIFPIQEAYALQCVDWFDAIDRARPISSWVKGMDALFDRMGTSLTEFRDRVQQQQRSSNRKDTESLGRPMGSPQTIKPGIERAAEDEGEDATTSRMRIGAKYD